MGFTANRCGFRCNAWVLGVYSNASKQCIGIKDDFQVLE